MNRLRELDFLRGAAILLVLLRHRYLFQGTVNMGWIGVDLFFVLSGFLVSGLLFREFIKYGDIQPKRFLIRRGFKIYPIYYLFYIPYMIYLFMREGHLETDSILYDTTFIQNYARGWGYGYAASWSLAIEEHFYFGFALLLWLGVKCNKTLLSRPPGDKKRMSSFQWFIIAALVLCFCLRLLSNYSFPSLQLSKRFTMTHLRIDSLLAGVFISYLYYFKRNELGRTVSRYKYVWIIIALAGLCWTPFIDDPVASVFVKTIGFSLLYISFGIILLFFILTPDINTYLNRVFSAFGVNLV
ncbi:MAG: acyltransferase family protein, partial [Bacteroidia bacterium]